MNTPNDATDDEIAALIEQEHPTGIGPFNAETILSNKPRNMQAVYVHGDTPLIDIARAFASIGYTLRGKRDSLVAEPAAYTEQARLDAVQRSGTGAPGSINEC